MRTPEKMISDDGVPFCYKDLHYFSTTSPVCKTCPVFNACATFIRPVTVLHGVRKKDFLRELLVQGAPPRVIDEAYMKLYGASMNAAKSARKYARRKLEKAQK